MVSGLLVQLQIYRQLSLIELLEVLLCQRLFELQYTKYPRVLHAGLFHKLKFYGILGWVFHLFFSKGWLQVVQDGSLCKNIQLMLGLLEAFILGLKLFLLYSDDLWDDVICNITIYGDDKMSAVTVIRYLLC